MTTELTHEISEQLDLLAACRSPYLIGVRHHSAAISRIIDPLLCKVNPSCILLELPTDFTPWLEFLTDEQTIAPVAISAADPDGNLAFYPLADFSPELVVLRWASRNEVPVIPMDLSAGTRVLPSRQQQIEACLANWLASQAPHRLEEELSKSSLLEHLLSQTHSTDTGQLWERFVETPGFVGDPESIRRAALLFGWAVRESTATRSREGIPRASMQRDLIRECAMREALRNAPSNSVACIGAFHASALLPPVVESSIDFDREILEIIRQDAQPVGVSLVPYSFEQLDERSGYPAGIRDPNWHNVVLAASNAEEIDRIATELVVDICRFLRSQGHVAGTPDAMEIVRMMRGLAKLRGISVAGRGECIEAIQSCLVQGELHGRARVVAQAMEHVLIGEREGKVSSRTPRCGLAVSIDNVFELLKLPTKEIKELRLDTLRDNRDRARAVVLRQLVVANIPYAKRIDSLEQGDRENLVEVWEAGVRQGTSATIEALSRFGVTLSQAVEGILQLRFPKTDTHSWNPNQLLELLATASECGLHRLTHQAIGQLTGSFLSSAQMAELVGAASHLHRILAGHVPGLPMLEEQVFSPILHPFQHSACSETLAVLIRASLDRLSGLTGSNDPEDVTGLAELWHWLRGSMTSWASAHLEPPNRKLLEQGLPQLVSWCQRTAVQGSPRMQGASSGLLCAMGIVEMNGFAALMEGWVDDAIDSASRKHLKESLAGTVQILLTRVQSEPQWLDGVSQSLQRLDDAQFLKRLHPLRDAFQEFSSADRQRILDVQLEPLHERESKFSIGNLSDDVHSDLGVLFAKLRRADMAGQAAVADSLLTTRSPEPEALSSFEIEDRSELALQGNSPRCESKGEPSERQISIADRWRMILGFPPESRLGYQAARALDQLYGRGKGEGARAGLTQRGKGGLGGTDEPTPTVAQWSEDLNNLFGSEICQEILGESAASGNLNAVHALDPDSVIPSVDLLKQVLSMAGTSSEAKTQRLRQLAKRITEQLAKELAVRVRPHVHGLSTPRPTRRRSKRLNLARTLRSNLINTIQRVDGSRSIVAKDLIFHSASKREMDWHLTFVVDVSGSMSASVVYSALCAAIFSELPALTVRFLAFSTKVIDLSDRVHDPLSLLLEVQVGGGTHIGLGLRHARAGLAVPSRSIVVLVTDFEEGVSPATMVAEVLALVESGAKCIGLAALDDSGVARFHQGYAQIVANAGMPVAAVSPERLASWVGDRIRNA
jgi:Mg-chelatase subunit ChlD